MLPTEELLVYVYVLVHDLAARFGRDPAYAEWFYGFRLAGRVSPRAQVRAATSKAKAAMMTATRT
jgi:hypothetical protein